MSEDKESTRLHPAVQALLDEQRKRINAPAVIPDEMKSGSARCLWCVTAGILPGEAVPEYTRNFGLTSEAWDEGSEAGAKRFYGVNDEAQAYADSIRNPARVNWVRVDWVWL